MFSPFAFDLYAKSHHQELMEEAARERQARMARGEVQKPSGAWPMIALSAAAGVISLLLLIGVH